jgi:hypothetical protein
MSAAVDWILFLNIKRVFLSFPRGLSNTTRKLLVFGEEFPAVEPVTATDNNTSNPRAKLHLGIGNFMILTKNEVLAALCVGLSLQVRKTTIGY